MNKAFSIWERFFFFAPNDDLLQDHNLLRSSFHKFLIRKTIVKVRRKGRLQLVGSFFTASHYSCCCVAAKQRSWVMKCCSCGHSVTLWWACWQTNTYQMLVGLVMRCSIVMTLIIFYIIGLFYNTNKQHCVHASCFLMQLSQFVALLVVLFTTPGI